MIISAATYNYNKDDSIEWMMDARGAKTTYTYNSRGLVTNINYTAPDDPNNPGNPDPNVPVPGEVIFTYDNAGNRISMDDDPGYVSYSYNELSQMTSETRTFADTLQNAPAGGFTLTYTYTRGGQLKSIKDPYNDQIDYTHDEAGRLTKVDGTTFGGVTNYGKNPHYRAWGGLQSLEYGNGLKMEMTFNNRLQAKTFKLHNPTTQDVEMDKTYEYYADGKLRKLNDNILYDTYGGTNVDVFDRLMKYDHIGRPTEGKSSAEARGGTVAPQDMEKELPYRQSYQFNAFGNMTQRDNKHWGIENWYGRSNNLSYTYLNNRITNPGWEHDADGRVTKSAYPDEQYTNTYDVKGQITRIYQVGGSDLNRYYDGNGGEAKRERLDWIEDQNGENGSWVSEEKKYFIRSSVLGNQVVTEVGLTGRKTRTFVFAAGTVLAWQNQGFYNNQDNKYVNFNYSDASGLSHRSADKDGDIYNYSGSEGEPAELDPLGGNVGLYTPYIVLNPSPPEPDTPMLLPNDPFDTMMVNGFRVPCTMDGVTIGCGTAQRMMESGSAIPASLAPYQHLPGFSFDNNGLGIYTVRIPKQVGWHVNPDNSVSRVYSKISFDSFTFFVPRNPSSPQDDLNSFLSESPRCATMLRALLAFQRKNISNLPIVEATGNQEILNKTLGELGLGENDTRTLDEYFANDGAEGITSTTTGQIYLGPKYSNEKSQRQRGIIIFHELLHSLYRSGHAELGTILGIEIPEFLLPDKIPEIEDIFDPGDFRPDLTRKRKEEERKRKEENRQRYIDNALIGGAITAYIENDCAVPTRYQRK